VRERRRGRKKRGRREKEERGRRGKEEREWIRGRGR
jgi:hypothetical protein